MRVTALYNQMFNEKYSLRKQYASIIAYSIYLYNDHKKGSPTSKEIEIAQDNWIAAKYVLVGGFPTLLLFLILESVFDSADVQSFIFIATIFRDKSYQCFLKFLNNLHRSSNRYNIQKMNNFSVIHSDATMRCRPSNRTRSVSAMNSDTPGTQSHPSCAIRATGINLLVDYSECSFWCGCS